MGVFFLVCVSVRVGFTCFFPPRILRTDAYRSDCSRRASSTDWKANQRMDASSVSARVSLCLQFAPMAHRRHGGATPHFLTPTPTTATSTFAAHTRDARFCSSEHSQHSAANVSFGSDVIVLCTILYAFDITVGGWVGCVFGALQTHYNICVFICVHTRLVLAVRTHIRRLPQVCCSWQRECIFSNTCTECDQYCAIEQFSVLFRINLFYGNVRCRGYHVIFEHVHI